jgi:GNAT superfamily N-acetyltransferase
VYRTQAKAARPVEFRAAGPRDAGQIRDFVNGLSPRTQFLRFFAQVAPPSSGLLRALSGTDGRADVVLAWHRGRLIGHGMAADRTGGDGARISDIGLVVADGWQQRGVGTALLRIMAARAAARGASMLAMDVLPGNDRILGVIEHRWPGARRERGPDSIIVRVDLTAADTDAEGYVQAAEPVPAPAGYAGRPASRQLKEGDRDDTGRPAKTHAAAAHPAA